VNRAGAVAVQLAGLLALVPGLAAFLDGPRRSLVAWRYFQCAQRHLTEPPVDRPRAAYELRRALLLAPRNLVLQAKAPELLLLAEDYQTPLALFRLRPPSEPLGLITYGHCLLMAGRKQAGAAVVMQAAADAEARLYRATSSPMEYALALNNASYALAEGGVHLVAAELLARKALAVGPLEPAFCDTLGWVLYRLGRPREAAFYLERAVRQQLPGADPLLAYHLGAAYAALYRHQEARRMLLWALALEPKRADAAVALRSLYRLVPQPTNLCSLAGP
jgi:tetratricopeptide (TPR) repeat protein